MKHALHLSRVANRSGRNLLGWCLFLGMSLLVNTVFATETEPTTKAPKNKEEIPHKKPTESTPSLPVSQSNNQLIKSQMQTALSQMNMSSRSSKKAVLLEQTAILDSLAELKAKLKKVNKLITKADSTFKILQRLGQLLNFEKFSSGLQVQFTIGLHQDFSGENAGVDIGFMNLRMTPSVNYLTVFARMKLPIKNPRTGDNYQDIFFGADIDYDGNVTQGYVSGKFSSVSESVQNLLGNIDLGSFAVKGFEKWGFRLNGAVLDFSETRNSSDVKFPIDQYITKGILKKRWEINSLNNLLKSSIRSCVKSQAILFSKILPNFILNKYP